MVIAWRGDGMGIAIARMMPPHQDHTLAGGAGLSLSTVPHIPLPVPHNHVIIALCEPSPGWHLGRRTHAEFLGGQLAWVWAKTPLSIL